MNSPTSERGAGSDAEQRLSIGGWAGPITWTPTEPTPAERMRILDDRRAHADHQARWRDEALSHQRKKDDRMFWFLAPTLGLCLFTCLVGSLAARDEDTRRWAQNLTLAVVGAVGGGLLRDKTRSYEGE